MKKNTLIFSFAILFCLLSVDSFAQTADFTFTMNPANGCTPVFVQFTDASTGASSYTWDFGDGTGNSVLQNPGYTYNLPGTYHVSLTINGGADVVIKDVIIHGTPSAGFIILDDTICAGNSITVIDTSHANDGSIVFWKWDFGDGVVVDTNNGNPLTHQYNVVMAYSINLRVENTYGCADNTISFNILVVDGANTSFTMSETSSCELNTTVNFTNLTTNAGNSTYTWNFGDTASGANNTSTATDPSHTFANAGQYIVTLVANKNGCKDSTTMIFYQSVMTATYTMSTDTICRYDSVLFDNTSVPLATSWIWNFDDPNSGINNVAFDVDSLYHVFVDPGMHNVQLIVSANGCSDTITQPVYVFPPPNVFLFTTDDSTYCQPPASIDFNGTSTNNIVSWLWDFGVVGNTDTSIVQNPSYTYTSFGNYTITLIGMDEFGCLDTFIHPFYIQIIAPVVTITDQPDSGCIGETFTFHTVTSTVAGDSVDQYTWNFGDGTGPIVGTATQSHTFNTCGIFDVQVDIHTRDGCTDNYLSPALIRIGDHPNADFTWQPPAMCYGDTVHFTDQSTVGNCAITGWLWDFGSIQQNPDHVYPDTGVYSVQLIVYSNGCADSITKSQIITIHPPKPLFDITYNCANPFSVLFTDQSHGDEWLLWDFGDGSLKDSTNNQTPTHVYPGVGTYSVTLYDTNVTWGCGYSLTQAVIVTDPIAAILADTSTKCYPATFSFDGTSSQSVNSVAWDFGDPGSGVLNFSNLLNPSHLYNASGDYIVKLVITDIHGCMDSITYTVHAWGPTAGFSVNNTTGCIPLSVNFSDTSDVFGTGGNIVSWYWDFNFPNVDTSTLGPNTSHVYPNSDQYDILLLVTDANGCTDTTLRTDYINATKPSPDLSVLDTFLCPGINNLSLITGVQTYPTYSVTWNYGDGTLPETINNDSNTTHNFTTEGIFLVSATVTDSNGCSTTVSRSVYVYDAIASAVVDSAHRFCGYIEIWISGATGAAGGYSNNWQFILTPPFGIPKTNVGSPNNNIFHVTVNVAGEWSLQLISTNPAGCVDTLLVTSFISVPGPEGYYSFEPDTGCSPLEVTFHITPVANADYIIANFGDGNVTGHLPITDTIITHTYYGNTGARWTPQILLGYTDDTMHCDAAIPNVNDFINGHDTNVSIINPATYTVTVDSILVNEGESDTLTAAQGYDPNLTYSWTVLPSGDPLVTLNPPTSAVYVGREGDEKIVFTVTDQDGCQSYDTVFIDLHLCEMELKIPNVFTPGGEDNSGDGKNDTYYINDLCPIEDFKITIFNRWGNIVYESEDYHFHWDGIDTNGKDCAEGVYYYTLHAKRKDLHGYIHVIRGKGSK